MASVVFSNQSQTQETTIPNKGIIEGLANKILGSVNPQETFNTLVSQNADAKKALDICNQYGNGDPKAAFMNYMGQPGKGAIGKAIMNKLGLG